MNEVQWRLLFVAVVAIMLSVRVFYDIRQKRTTGGEELTHWHQFLAERLAPGLGIVGLIQLTGYEIWPMSFGHSLDVAIRVVGFVVVCFGAALFTWPRVVRTRTWAGASAPPNQVEGYFLCTSGPYKYVRHPFYGSSVFGIAGLELMLASWLVVFFVPLFFVYLVGIVEQEEKKLIEVYGDAYREYKKRVPRRLIPLVY